MNKILKYIGAVTVVMWVVALIALGPCLFSGTCELAFITEEKQ